MISGSELRDARSRAGLTQEQLAERLDVTLRSVGNWERSKVPPNREGLIREVLAGHMGGGATPSPLSQASDVALLAELARRLSERQEVGDVGSTRQKMIEGTGGGTAGAEPVPERQGSIRGKLSAGESGPDEDPTPVVLEDLAAVERNRKDFGP